jgi:endoglucanase
VNRAGGEYACVQKKPFLDGPSDDGAVAAIGDWHGNAVRLPLNEDCWLGLRGAPAPEAYRAAIHDFARRLERRGMYVILDLHWSAAEPDPAMGQAPMPDVDHAPDFWASVAARFADDRAVLFDLFNEPFDVDWGCWRDGCARAAGMQRLVDAVRGAGARQPILVSGLRYGNDLAGWLAHAPVDPLNQLVAAAHAYDFNACADAACWEREWAGVAARVPLVVTEFGADKEGAPFMNRFMDWADTRGVSYLGWTWNPWPGKIALIRDWSGTPTEIGAALKARLAR